MAKQKAQTEIKPRRKGPPALTPEAREDQLIALAIDLAEQRLLNGTASSQEITHFLKLGSTEARVRRKLLEEQAKLASAKTGAIESAKDIAEKYGAAIEAMKRYSGNSGMTYDEEL